MKRAPAKVSLESSTATQGQFRVLIFIPCAVRDDQARR
ncbi:Uncharacterised protein [Vibrio cholerae]|nr:Uncharacterised protein [Vibrio cholerae]CSA13084.1 Uncharacterised protein [Vibrio cholerae]CSA29123.1 Uncharacterised protein [Vibrio cholerae]CSA45205.1 Uncharacterised protein [Vibrio cholerae]CSA45634.1 Uncharacterised protein [Vibrio cholerae]